MPAAVRTWTSSEKRAVGARQAWRCAKCEQLLPATFDCDHVTPLHLGGVNDILTNCQALCNACHARKCLAERLAVDDAIRKARASAPPARAAPPPTTRKRPLSGKRPLLDAAVGADVLQNRFLAFGYVRP